MKNFTGHIDKFFSNEMYLLILLSRERIEESEVLKANKNIDWELFLRLIVKHRLISHVFIHSNFLQNFIPEVVFEELQKLKLSQSKLALKYSTYLIQIHGLFHENEIKHCFFKGPLLSHELYQDIGFRNFGDIDILVNINDAEKAKELIERLRFKCIYPKIKLNKKQQKINYSISHHYHFKLVKENIDVELHWSISNPESYVGMKAAELIETCASLQILTFKLPYLSETENLVYLSAHGAIHQWYKLFWLKDFSVLLAKFDSKTIEKAWILAEKLKLKNCFMQACQLSDLLFKTELPTIVSKQKGNNWLLETPLKSIQWNELKQQGHLGKFKYVFYRLRLKPKLKYYFDLLYRLRTHLSDWEFLPLPPVLFFLYYPLRPVLLVLKSLKRK